MDQQEGMGVSRRSFVKGSTVTALAALAASGGAASLFGCAPKETAEEPGGRSDGAVFANEVPEGGGRSSGRAAAIAASSHAPSNATSSTARSAG